MSDLLPQGNNRQAVSDFIRQQFGQTALSQLTPDQLKTVLTLLQNNQLAIPQPQQRPATDRPLLPAEHNSLNQLVTKLAAATGESGKQIWQSMLELSGVKTGELIPAKHFASLTTWLQARQTLSQQSAPTLHSVQAALKQPLEPQEWKEMVDYSQQRFQATPQTVLTTAQVQDILNQVFLKRAERQPATLEVRDIQPIYNPMFSAIIEPIKALSARPGLALIALVVVMILLWLVI
ncbi:Flagellar regulator flk [Cedecea neteri]|uniref:Flagellar regulator flk n=1 Tax=Cedecea neteri TaxID=158822 RepID=A0A2X3J7I0_9ENTR|nr:Flagellar regulator flk [Cedecea neteri]